MAQPKDISTQKRKHTKETITPHRLTVAILIKDFCEYKELSTFKLMSDEQLKVKYRRGFALLSLKLIQSPDLTLEELRSLLSSKNYGVDRNFIDNHFEKTLAKLSLVGSSALLDVIDGFHRIIVNEINGATEPVRSHVSKNSVTGFFLRRLLLSLDKLTFSEITTVVKNFRQYYKPPDGITETPTLKKEKVDLELVEWLGNREQWSRRQAELFVATQAALVTGNEEKAISPAELNQHIRNLLKSNPDLAEAHFLSYLNYLRVKEFCGAIDSLHHSFDKSAGLAVDKIPDEKSKFYRYAALNLAVLHYHFGHREEALVTLREAIKISQEANDNVCLQHALSWLYCLTLTNKDKLIEHSILKSLELNLSYTMSFGIQCFVQYAGMTSGNPKQIFETTTKGDIINSQHNHWDLISNSYIEKSCLWLLYGKTEMASLWSQLFLYLNTDTTELSKTCHGESFCRAVCDVANQLAMHGEYRLVHSVLGFVKDRFPNELVSHVWMLCENLVAFTRALYQEKWDEAEAAAQNMAVLHKWESRLRLAELFLHRQDFVRAQASVSEILDECQKDLGPRIDIQVRALILLAEIQSASSFPSSVPSGLATLLSTCLSYANEYHLDYQAALVHLHLANVQLLMGSPARALKTVDKCLVQVLAHGGCFDRARALMMYVKCLVANSAQEEDSERKKVIGDAARMLDEVKELFEKMEAYGRVKDVLYMQAHLYNEIGYMSERNKCAFDFRIYEEEHPTNNNYTLLRYL